MVWTDVLIHTVAPASGVLICAAMYGSPLQQIRRVRAENKLGVCPFRCAQQTEGE